MANKKSEECAKRLARLLKKQMGDCWKKKKDGKLKAKIGCWDIDCNPIYGGCVIEEMMSEGGGVDHPFGPRRRKPTEFCDTINFAIRVMEYRKRKRR